MSDKPMTATEVRARWDQRPKPTKAQERRWQKAQRDLAAPIINRAYQILREKGLLK